MKERIIGALAVVGASALAACALWLWFSRSGAGQLRPRLPGEDGAAQAVSNDAATAQNVAIGESFQAFGGNATDMPGSWPCFRGPDRNNVGKEPVPLATAWPSNGPPVLWSADLGEGYAGPAVHKGRVYVLDYDEKAQADMLRCFALRDGHELWRRGYHVHAKRNHGFSRTVPAVTDQYVVTLGPQCHVMCVDAVSGDLRWGLDLVRDYGTTVPLWYAGQCPLIDGGLAILAPGGTNLLMAVDCATGRVVWQAPNPHGWQMSHSSVAITTVGGRRMYVYFAVGGIAGVAADGPDAGRVLWESAEWAPNVVAPTPVPLDDGRLFLTVGYGGGSEMLQVAASETGFAAKVLYKLPKTVFACEQQTPILYKGCLWSILPKDAEALRGQLACMRPDGTLAWTSGKAQRYGLGPFLIADDKVLILTDEGILTLLSADPNGYTRLAETKVLQGREAWAPMALAGGLLVLRDEKRMLCVDLRAGERNVP